MCNLIEIPALQKTTSQEEKQLKMLEASKKITLCIPNVPPNSIFKIEPSTITVHDRSLQFDVKARIQVQDILRHLILKRDKNMQVDFQTIKKSKAKLNEQSKVQAPPKEEKKN